MAFNNNLLFSLTNLYSFLYLYQFRKYPFERKTADLILAYYVKENFEEDKTNLAKIEEQVNAYYIHNLSANCFRETNYRKLHLLVQILNKLNSSSCNFFFVS